MEVDLVAEIERAALEDDRDFTKELIFLVKLGLEERLLMQDDRAQRHGGRSAPRKAAPEGFDHKAHMPAAPQPKPDKGNKKAL